MNPVISFVTGTFNRLPLLTALMASVRNQMPVGLPYEWVICDGGSSDGTLEFLRSQSDVSLIEHGELRGAIAAFTDAANMAHGKYVLLLNDDIVVREGAILRALVHIENTPRCGAVAFADNRPSPNKVGHAVMHITAQAPLRSVPYAQVGLFRNWLGREIGWWGGNGIMAKAKTYAGDAFLSARIYELGYTVDPVDGVEIDERIIEDGLREINEKHGHIDGGVYGKLFPNGVQVAPAPTLPSPDKRQLRILYLPVYEPGHTIQKQQKHGLRDALAKYYLVYELDYLALGASLRTSILEAIDTFKPDMLLSQLHGANVVTPELLAEVHAASPRIVVVNWNGDYWPHGLTAPDMLQLLRQVDLQLVVNADVLPFYQQHNIAAAYWQIGYEDAPEPLPDMPSHDIVFLANAYSTERQGLGAALQALPYNVGIYGSGWEGVTRQNLYNFSEGAALYRNAKISIGDNQFTDARGFVSNRIFQALAAGGAMLMHQYVPGLKELTGLTGGLHFIEWKDLDELRGLIQYWMQPKQKKDRQKIADYGMRYVHEYHSFDARVRELFTTLMPKARRDVRRHTTLEYLGNMEEIGVRGALTQIQYVVKKGQPVIVDSLDAPYILRDASLWREKLEAIAWP